jgi:hypothetical protein
MLFESVIEIPGVRHRIIDGFAYDDHYN